MATLLPSSSSPAGDGASFRVSTREISLDFSTVGADQSPHELGAVSAAAFRHILDKFAGLTPIKLVDGDPQLVVIARQGRFIILPSNGQLLLRSVHDPQQPYLKFTPSEVLAFLETNAPPPPTLTPIRFPVT